MVKNNQEKIKQDTEALIFIRASCIQNKEEEKGQGLGIPTFRTYSSLPSLYSSNHFPLIVRKIYPTQYRNPLLHMLVNVIERPN